MKKKESFLFIEQCFRNIQHEKEIDKNLSLIERAIDREYGIKLDIRIVKNKKQFFGMCIYPHVDEIDCITEWMIDSSAGNNLGLKNIEALHREFMTKTVKVVEIDSILLYDHNLNATPAEITAILLHEIGHIVASNSITNKVLRAKEYLMLKLDSATRRKLFNVPFIFELFKLLTMQILSFPFNVQLLKEKEADELAVKEGYGEDLYSVLGKLIANGKGDQVRKTEKEQNKDIEITVDWLITNIKELQYRKDRLKRTMLLLKLSTPSELLKNRISNSYDRMFSQDGKIQAQLINEAFIFSTLNNKKMKAPSGAIDRGGRVVRLNARDLDIYRAELERVNTVDDKIFLLERLYDLLDVADYAKYMLQTDPRRVMQSEVTINNYIESLNEIIKNTNQKQIAKTKYGLFIKYPADYEG